MRGRTAQAGIPKDTSCFLQHRARPGDILVCFDEYADYFARRNEVHAYGSVDDRAGEPERLLAVLEPLLSREEDLWVQCSPNQAAARAEGEALEKLGFTLSRFPDERRSTGKGGSSVIIGKTTFRASDRSEFLDRAAESIAPCGHPFTELEGYLAEHWGGMPHKCFPHERDKFIADLLLHQWYEEGRDMGDWWQSDAIQWFYDHPGVGSGWDLRCMKLAALRRPEPEHRVDAMVYSCAPDELIVQFETTREEFSSISGPVDEAELERFVNELTLWRGVTEADIRTRSPRFQLYAYTLKKLGRL